TSTPKERPSGCTLLPGCRPSSSPSGISCTPRSWKPTTSARIERSSLRLVTRQSSPRPTSTPAASITSPTTRVTRPKRAKRGRSAIRCTSSSGEGIGQPPVGPHQRRIHPPIDDPIAPFDQASARHDVHVGDPLYLAAIAHGGQSTLARRTLEHPSRQSAQLPPRRLPH